MSILPMTATVSPPSTAVNPARADPAGRLDDDATALAHDTELHDEGMLDALLFVENSGAGIGALKGAGRALGAAVLGRLMHTVWI